MNTSHIHHCYGCGLCATVCAKHIIDIKMNDDGFYEPLITDSHKCTDCGQCTEVCAYSHKGLSLNQSEIHSYAAWSNNHAVRRKCSSGGVGMELGLAAISEGYKVCGVRYNVELERAEHFIATTPKELVQSAGSKYIQSYTLEAFKTINRKEKYLITGTPCQIDSFRRYAQKFRIENNFLFMDFFCHGVPSHFVWQKYIHEAEKMVGKITYASWRNKLTGWHDSWVMSIDGERKHGEKVNWHDSYNVLIREKKSFLNFKLSQGDKFYTLFLGDGCLGAACYDHCKYKYKHSSADIRIGDAWGSAYAKDEDGVNAAIAFTTKGNEWLHKADIHLEEQAFEVVSELQIKEAVKRPPIASKLMKILRQQDSTIDDVYHIQKSYNVYKQQIQRLRHPKRTIINLFKRFLK